METSNRFAQVGWLRELAGDIASYYAGLGTAEDIVAFALNDANWAFPDDRIELPSWFDEHDQRLLTKMVERRIA